MVVQVRAFHLLVPVRLPLIGSADRISAHECYRPSGLPTLAPSGIVNIRLQLRNAESWYLRRGPSEISDLLGFWSWPVKVFSHVFGGNPHQCTLLAFWDANVPGTKEA